MWFTKAAEQGYAEAQGSLGMFFTKGCGVKQDLEQAAKWYAKAAKQNQPESMYIVGTNAD